MLIAAYLLEFEMFKFGLVVMDDANYFYLEFTTRDSIPLRSMATGECCLVIENA